MTGTDFHRLLRPSPLRFDDACPAEQGFKAAHRDHPETILVIDAPDALALIGRLPRRASVVMARFGGLNRALLLRVMPDRVMVPLIGRSFDARDGISRLKRLRYGGQICVIAPPLPDHAMVEAELRALAPGLAIAVLDRRS